MTRPICILLALFCSSAAADSSSALRGTSPIQRRLLNDHVINVPQSTVFERNDAIIRSGEEVDEQMEHRSLEEMTIIIPTIALEQTIDTSQSVNSSFVFTMKEKADDVIQSIAENHLAVVYADSFPAVGAPTKVLLTVVTNNDDEREEAIGIFVRKSFLGGVVTFPESSKTLSQSELEKVTLDAFTVPGLGQSFLDKLKDEKHPDLEGLLLINSKKLQQGGPVATSPDPPTSSNNGNATEDTSPMSSIWAIAAVVALGAMLLTIILCTSILYCDYRKRKERVEQRRAVSSNHRERRKSRQSGSNKREKSSQSNNAVDHLEIVVPAASGETEVSASPSTQGSNEMGGNVVGRGSIRGSIFKSRRSSTAKSKSKAASTQLQDSTSIEENNYVAQKAPSEVYSVGEDTTMLYPAMNRARTTSKDNMSEDFDGYSMDGMSAMDGGVSTIGNDNKSTSRSINRDAIYAGDAGRDFDSIWDEQSKLTNDGVVSVDGPTKEAYGDLSKPLNELIENQDEENQSSAASVDFDSGSESGSNIGKFTLELLGQGKSKKSDQEEEEEDSILGGMYDDTSESGNVPSSGDSVDSTPSWAAPIQSAINSAKRSSVGIFRTLSGADDDSSKASSVNDKFVSSLSRTETDDESVKSGSSRGSRGSGSIGSRQSGTAKPSSSNALGYTNSADDEVDEHPDAMIDNINSMLSECRVILDKDGEK